MDGRVRIGTELDSSGISSGIKNIEKIIAGAGIATLLAKTVKEGIENFSTFENVLKKSETLYGDVQVSQANLEKQMLSLSSSTGEAVEVLGEGLYTALSAGIPVTEDMGEAMSFLETNTKLAKAGFTDVQTSVGATSKVLNAYKMETSEIDRVSNVLIATQNKGITTVGELSQYLAQVTPIASAMGVSFEEVGASLATMTAQGTPTAQATTQLRQTITELSKEGTVASNNLAKVAESAGLSQTSFKEMIDSGMTLDEILKLMGDYAEANNISMVDMFSSIEAGQGALALSGKNAEKFSENLDYMRESAGLVDKAYEAMSDSFKTSFSRLKESVTNLSISIVKDLEPALTPIVSGLATLAENLAEGSSTADKLESEVNNLVSTSKDYKDTTNQLINPTKDLTEAEKARLDILKGIQATAFEESLYKMSKAYVKNQEAIEESKEKLNELKITESAYAMVQNDFAEGQKRLFELREKDNLTVDEQIEKTQLANAIMDKDIQKRTKLLTVGEQIKDQQDELNELTGTYDVAMQSLAESVLNGTADITNYAITNKEFYDAIMDNVDAIKKQKKAQEMANYVAIAYKDATDEQINNAIKQLESNEKTYKSELYLNELYAIKNERLAEVAKKTESLEEAEKSRAEIVDNANKAIATAEEYQTALGDSYDLNYEKSKILEDAIKSLIDSGLDPESKQVQDLKTQLDSLADTSEDTSDETFSLSKALDDNQQALERAEIYSELLGDSYDLNEEKTRILESTIKSLIENGIDPESKAIKDLKAQLNGLGDTTGKVQTLGDAIKDSVAGSLGMSNDELDMFIEALEDSENVFEKITVLGMSVADTITSGIEGSILDVGEALADVTDGTSSWGDAFKSIGGSITDTIGDIAKEMAKQLAGIAVVKALAGDWVGAGLALGGAIALGYGGSLIQKVSSWIGAEPEEVESEPTYEDTKASEAESIKAQISTTEQDRDRAFNMAETATNPEDVRYYTQIYLDLNEDLEQLRRDLQFAQGFSTGGLVGGTSYTGDKLLAWVNSKELILNQQQQSALSSKIGTLTSLASQAPTLVVNVLGDTFGVEDFYNKVYNGIKGLQYEGAIKSW